MQVLLLEEARYTVPEAYIYYAAERQRLRIVVDDTLRHDAVAELDAAKRAAAGARPPPLVNDSRCPRCSLQPICLPDEINQQRLIALAADGRPADEQLTPRKLWPPRDDGIHVVLQREGVRVGIRGQTVRITDKDGDLVRDMPLANVESLAVLGGVQVSTQALGIFADQEVPVAFLSAAGRLVAMMDALGPTSAAVRAAQVRVLDRPDKALELACAVTVAKIANQRTLLMRNHAGLSARIAADLQECVNAAERVPTIDELRGHEGNAAAIYFKHFAGMFKEGVKEIAARFHANGRQRRPPPDPINSVLSFGYSMLTNECVAACRLASLEPTLGALHATRPGRPAMALDLVEPFRPLIADSVAVSVFNRGGCAAAAALLDDAVRNAEKPEVKRELSTLKAVIDAYAAWDRFHHKAAARRFADALRNRNDLAAIFPHGGPALVTRLERHRDRVAQLAGQNEPTATWVEDLLHNARRRAAERRFDDAVARLYRAFEALAQVRLREKHGIRDTKAVTLAQLPDALRTEWANRGHDNRSFKLALQDAWRVLKEFGDELGREFFERGLADDQKSPLVARNQSILAHGFQPVGETVYNQVHEKLRPLVQLDGADSQDWRLPLPR